MFIAKYTNFKNETGGNFLFRDRIREKNAITKIRALLRIIPFSDIQINQITHNINKIDSQFYKGSYGNEDNYKIFSGWVSDKKF